MDMRAIVAESNIRGLCPRLSHGAIHPQITSCGLLSLPRIMLQIVSMVERKKRKKSLPQNVVRASSGQDYECGNNNET